MKQKKIHLAKTQCDQCLFSNNRIVSEDRAKEIIEQCDREAKYFECHKGTIKGKKIVCRGYYDYWVNKFYRALNILVD